MNVTREETENTPVNLTARDAGTDRRNADIPEVLRTTRLIAAVGASPKPNRPSYYVLSYLQSKGFSVIPVNPAAAGQSLFGEEIVACLADIPADRGPVDMVDIFRTPDAAPGVVREAVECLGGRGLRTIWMQLGVISEEAARIAEEAGLQVVMDRCPKIEYARHFGELGWSGINTGILSARLR